MPSDTVDGGDRVPKGTWGQTDPLPELPDRYGVVLPDGTMFDCTEAARLFDQDPEQRARRVASRYGGQAVRIVTELVALDV